MGVTTSDAFPETQTPPNTTAVSAPVTRGVAVNTTPTQAPATRTGQDMTAATTFGTKANTGLADPSYATTQAGGTATPMGTGTTAGAGTTTTTTTPTNALLSQPGAYEEWLKANMGQLNDPTRVENLYDSGAFGSLTQPSAISKVSPIAQNGFTIADLGNTGNSAGVLSTLSGPSGGPSVGYSAGVLGSLTTGPSSGANIGASRDVLGNLTTGPTDRANIGASRDVLSTLSAGPSNSTGVFDAASADLGEPGELERRYASMGTAFDEGGAYENFFGQYGSDPMQKSYTETLYESGLGQLDPYYDYAVKRSIDAAQRASSARGGFNSGLAAQQESDIIGNLRGQQAKTWVDLAPVADSTKRARYQQGSDFAKTASDEYSERILNAFGIAKDTQAAEENRLDTLSGIASRGDAADTARANTRVTAAGNVDQAENQAYASFWDALNTAGANRIDAAGNVDRAENDAFANFWTATNQAGQNRVSAAGNADDASVDAYSAEWTARNNADSNRISAAGNADTSAINTFRAQNEAAYQSGQLSLAQYQANITLANSQDATTRGNATTIADLAGRADASDIGRLTTQGGMAADLQTTGQNRILGGLDAITGQSSREADLARQIYNDMSSVNQLDDVSLQALADKYGIQLQMLKDAVSAGGDIIANITKILTMK